MFPGSAVQETEEGEWVGALWRWKNRQAEAFEW
jgi:hypothetical protein